MKVKAETQDGETVFEGLFSYSEVESVFPKPSAYLYFLGKKKDLLVKGDLGMYLFPENKEELELLIRDLTELKDSFPKE